MNHFILLYTYFNIYLFVQEELEKHIYLNICFMTFVPLSTNTTDLDLHGHFVCMIIIQSETSSIAVETLEIPQIEVQIEQIHARDEDNNTERNLQDEDTHHRISIISDTDYNASAESNNSSRRSSVDVPQFELCSHRNHRRTENCDGEDRSEVGRL